MHKGKVKCVDIDYAKLENLSIEPCFTLGKIYKCEFYKELKGRMDIVDDTEHVWDKKRIDGILFKFQIV